VWLISLQLGGMALVGMGIGFCSVSYLGMPFVVSAFSMYLVEVNASRVPPAPIKTAATGNMGRC